MFNYIVVINTISIYNNDKTTKFIKFEYLIISI